MAASFKEEELYKNGGDIFPVTCPVESCKYEFYARKSLLHKMGINRGGGQCPKCNTYVSLTMFPDTDGFEMHAHVRDTEESEAK